MPIFITGVAGFIGFHVAKLLLERGERIIGVDNLNDYYDVSLKEARLDVLRGYKGFEFHKLDIADRSAIEELFLRNRDISRVIHLASQAGVRYSLKDPYSYLQTNIYGHLNLLEMLRSLDRVDNFVFASSSSVYGANSKIPFSTKDRVDEPLSFYAATKKTMEMMSHCYGNLYGIPQIGLRFFTVYGPWGRPDMAMFIFTRKILAGEPIQVFNNGDMRRDFTYIDDIVQGVVTCVDNPPDKENGIPYRLYNIGNHKSEELMQMVHLIERNLGKKAIIQKLPMQPGDFQESFADISEMENEFGFSPKIGIEEGIPRFIDWYKSYYAV